ncbi:hypothetical protein HFN89_06040 [Rhizobium laguerreae]|nr:hypothetical protein [Rhizobium laguerreae]
MKTALVTIMGVSISLLSTVALATGGTESFGTVSNNHVENDGGSSGSSHGSGGGSGGGGGTDWSGVAGVAGSILGTIVEVIEEQQEEDAARQSTELSTEEKLREIEALKEKFRREAEREVANKKWWTDEDTREVERGIGLGLVDNMAKVQLGSFIKETFGSGDQQTTNLSDTAAEVMLNLKMGVSGAVGRVGDVKAGLKKEFTDWLDQLKNDIDEVD